MFFFLQKKASKDDKIILNEAERHMSDGKKSCTIFNNFFSNAVSDLKIPNYYIYFSQKNTHYLSSIIETFGKHSSILNNKKRNSDPVFHSERLFNSKYRKLSGI